MNYFIVVPTASDWSGRTATSLRSHGGDIYVRSTSRSPFFFSPIVSLPGLRRDQINPSTPYFQGVVYVGYNSVSSALTWIQTQCKDWPNDRGLSAHFSQTLSFRCPPQSVTCEPPPKCSLIISAGSQILPALSCHQARAVWKSLQSAASSGDKACGDKEGAPWWSTFRALTLPPRLIIIPPQSKAQ